MDADFIEPKSIRRKAARLATGAPPGVLDLFCGCGGISLGFKRAGAQVIGGLDVDLTALKTWWLNFRPEKGLHLSGTCAIDIAALTARQSFELAGISEFYDKVDIMVGGPPCQPYSRVGKGKLASIAGIENAHLQDDRGSLWTEFIKYVRELQPLAVLVENVPDSLNYGSRNIPRLISETLHAMGYCSKYTILNAANYGVPQSRERVFILAVHTEVYRGSQLIPSPINRLSQDNFAPMAFRSWIDAAAGDDPFFNPAPSAASDLPEAINVQQAIGDLPVMKTLPCTPSGKSGCSNINNLLPYSSQAQHPYQTTMRSWPGYESPSGFVSGNVIRFTPRDFPIFREMKEGDDYRHASFIADKFFNEALSDKQGVSERDLTASEIKKLRKAFIPPYDRTKFLSKWTKLRRNRPSHTIVAHLQMDTYSHIHYDSDQARGISVREAARLQSFPDGFKFCGNMGEAFAQIGNAVPPLLAYRLGLSLISLIYAGIKK